MNDLIFFDLYLQEKHKEKGIGFGFKLILSFLVVITIMTGVYIFATIENTRLLSEAAVVDAELKSFGNLADTSERGKITAMIQKSSMDSASLISEYDSYKANNKFSTDYMEQVIFSLRPADVQLSSFIYSGGIITISVSCVRELGLGEFANKLRKSAFAENVVYAGVANQDGTYSTILTIETRSVN